MFFVLSQKKKVRAVDLSCASLTEIAKEFMSREGLLSESSFRPFLHLTENLAASPKALTFDWPSVRPGTGVELPEEDNRVGYSTFIC